MLRRSRGIRRPTTTRDGYQDKHSKDFDTAAITVPKEVPKGKVTTLAELTGQEQHHGDEAKGIPNESTWPPASPFSAVVAADPMAASVPNQVENSEKVTNVSPGLRPARR
uniref:Uncharacterized protein n=1 Tax=Candidatus Kentrum sp. LFY TaxID=2126342 RepID=A0A450WR57_9GAMM|nr:MAG: hypothetical protein BECKLFY1418C_GA0070996_105813 [Candidatus Kentron sp. LFY]